MKDRIANARTSELLDNFARVERELYTRQATVAFVGSPEAGSSSALYIDGIGPLIGSTRGQLQRFDRVSTDDLQQLRTRIDEFNGSDAYSEFLRIAREDLDR
jgi:hypothetical protein